MTAARIFFLLLQINCLIANVVARGQSVKKERQQLKKTLNFFSEECSEEEIVHHFVTKDENKNLLQEYNLEEFVNILGGTNSHHDVSNGNTLPLITRPWGFNSYAPTTDEDPLSLPWWFHPSDRRFFGLRVTHQPSPWINDYGNFLIKVYLPYNAKDPFAQSDRYTGYSPTQSEWHPYYFSTRLFSYGNSAGKLQLELTPSQHGGMIRATFPKYIEQEKGDDTNNDSTEKQLRRIAIVLSGKHDEVEIIASPIDGTAMIAGNSRRNNGGIHDGADFAQYFVIAVYNGANGQGITSIGSSSVKAENAWIDFRPEDANNDVLTVRFATSFISREQALQNLKAEVPSTKGFDDLRQEAQQEWRNVLSRVKITQPPVGYSDCQLRQLYTIFYSSLYRASVFPRQISEVDAAGNLVHWSPYANSNETRVQSGALSTDSGFWDAWNTIYPLMSLHNRPMLSTSLQGWVNAYSEGGWLPKWASPGYRGSMIGTMGDVSLADAIVNEIPNFDVQKAYEAIRKDSLELPPKGVEGVGRACLEPYLKYGYIPRGVSNVNGDECNQVIAETLNYYQADYAIAQAALKLGYTEDANLLLQRSQNFSKIFDPNTRFFRSKQGVMQRWTTPFDQFTWSQDYTESGPWQYRFYIPYDPKGLSDLYTASGANMCEELLKVQTAENVIFHLDDGASESHEQTEFADHCWGQYAHNNQPVHHMLYMHMYDGYGGACSNQGRYWIREVLLRTYKPDINMFPGDEDNGEMGAWFVLSAIGLYQRSPGSGYYELGVPLFGEIEIDISDIAHNLQNPQILSNANQYGDLKGKESKKLIIEAKNNSYENTHVQRVLWNGIELSSSVDSISYAQLAEGGTLTFEMGPNFTPPAWKS